MSDPAVAAQRQQQRQQGLIAGLQRDGRAAIDHQLAATFQHGGVERLTRNIASNAPFTRPLHPLGVARSRLQQGDNLGQGIGHGRTIREVIWTLECSASCGRDRPWTPVPT